MDRGRPLEHHRLRDRRLRRQAARPPAPVTPGRAVPALPARHAPGVLRRRRSPRRLRVPALRAARPEVAALPRGLRDAPGDEPVVRRRPVGRVRDLPRRAGRRARTTARSSSASRATAFRPHKRLLDHVARVIRNEPAFMLLDEQLVAYNAILDAVRGGRPEPAEGRRSSSRAGRAPGSRSSPSTSSPSSPQRGLRTLHLTGSKAFTENLRKIVGGRAGALFKYFRDTATVTSRSTSRSSTRRTGSGRSAPAASRRRRRGRARRRSTTSSTPAASSVFFIDDLQVVRPGEVGSTDLIREAAAKRWLEVRDFKLEAQFRSNGSDSFIQWVDNTLELDRTPQVLWPMDDEFDFQIVGSSGELERLIRSRAGEGATARLVAGFCWPWSDPDDAGQLVARRQGRGLVDALERQATASAGSAPASRSPTSGRARRRGSTRSAASTPRRASSSTTSA